MWEKEEDEDEEQRAAWPGTVARSTSCRGTSRERECSVLSSLLFDCIHTGRAMASAPVPSRGACRLLSTLCKLANQMLRLSGSPGSPQGVYKFFQYSNLVPVTSTAAAVPAVTFVPLYLKYAHTLANCSTTRFVHTAIFPLFLRFLVTDVFEVLISSNGNGDSVSRGTRASRCKCAKCPLAVGIC